MTESNNITRLEARNIESDKKQLLDLILKDGILYRSETQPVRSRDGSSGLWMLDSLCVSLTSEGLMLAARCLLDRLGQYEGRQIATYGVTAIPLVSACVLLSEGRYESILVRKERKPYGSSKLIEGRVRTHEPVILIDDSVSSGTSMTEACQHLEAAGLRVEGGVSLVRFGWYGGFARMQEQGYHMETVFDLDQDLIANMPDEVKLLSNPTKHFPDFEWQEASVSEGLHPAEFARQLIGSHLQSGKLLRPAQTLDRQYASEGGCWISLRQHDNIHQRHARDGFWHFPGETIDDTPDELALACLKVAQQLPSGEAGLQRLQDSAIAVTFFSRLEAVQLGELDNDRYGIVVCSRERPDKMGGALPRMPGIGNEWQQYQHARINNAQLVSFEPHIIYRHEVEKVVEEGIDWQSSGVPVQPSGLVWHRDPHQAGRVAQRARAWLIAALVGQAPKGDPLPAHFLHSELDSVYISVYIDGQVRGCMGCQTGVLEDDLALLTEQVLGDQRFSPPLSANDIDSLVVKASLLYQPLEMGNWAADEVMHPVRFGEQALMVYQHDRSGILLPEIAVNYNYSAHQYALEVIDKAGITRPPYYWRRYDCTSWLATGAELGNCQIMEGAFPEAGKQTTLPQTMIQTQSHQWADYIQRQQQTDGSLLFYYAPFQNQQSAILDNVRSAHTAWVLARYAQINPAAIAEPEQQALHNYLLDKVQQDENKAWLSDGPDDDNSMTGTALLLLALSEYENQPSVLAGKLAHTLWASMNPHGRIQPKIDSTDEGHDVYQDYIPGQVLLALAHAHRTGATELDQAALNRSLSFYWHRFMYKRRIDQASWLSQALFAWWSIRRDPMLAEHGFTICDWLLTFQSQKHGGFFTPQQVDTPGYTTALYLEALASAARVAGEIGDHRRQQTYLHSCYAGFDFMDRLTIQARDAVVLPNPTWAMGGIRASQYSSEMRIDFTQHALSAALELMPWHIACPAQSEDICTTQAVA